VLGASRMKIKAPPSTIDPVRCRYCVESQNFLQMVAHLDGRFICGRCGHVEIPNVEFECNCGNCAEVKGFELSRSARPT
jgi:ribosomal protein S27AE